MNGSDDIPTLKAQIASLEKELKLARSALTQDSLCSDVRAAEKEHDAQRRLINGGDDGDIGFTTLLSPSMHNLMLLSDSALPLGSFAYSGGLESFLAHNKPLPPGMTPVMLFQKFLSLSIRSMAYTNLPYVLASYRNSATLLDLDNDLDASTPCTVARRASVAQGRALLSVWEKAFMSSTANSPSPTVTEAVASLKHFSRQLKINLVSQSSQMVSVNGHLAPLWGCVCLALGLSIDEMGYLFLLNHAKATVSAGIRASVLGPYFAHGILAGQDLQHLIKSSMENVWHLHPEDAGQVVPVMDLWIGRHELLYSRIFNS